MDENDFASSPLSESPPSSEVRARDLRGMVRPDSSSPQALSRASPSRRRCSKSALRLDCGDGIGAVSTGWRYRFPPWVGLSRFSDKV